MNQSLDTHVRTVAAKFFTAINTPISLSCFLLLEAGEWEQLTEKRVDPTQYLDCLSGLYAFERDYQSVSFLRKYDGFPISENLQTKAVDAFYASEARCKLSNVRLSLFDHPIGIDPSLLQLLHDVRKTVASILGSCPSSLEGRFGPGTVYEFTRAHGNVYRNVCGKLMSAIHCTPASTAIVENTVSTTKWREALFAGVPSDTALRIVPGNRFTTVPKDSRTLRGICVEPSGNLFCQLGVGGEIRHRLLLRAGIDLDHGQSLHAMMAQEGSRFGTYATIDIRNASDTICRQFVKLALGYCPEWYSLLDYLRSPKTRVSRKWVWLEKFSSMGNGFTFELETLLFYAICIAVTGLRIGDPRVKVYGDDIIVPVEAADKVLSALEVFGFTPNQKKTFLSGPFRESCGGDFFLGYRVTPMYIKEQPLQPSDWITIANGLYDKRHIGGFPSCFHARRQIPRNIATFGPRELGDVCLHERDPRRWTHRWDSGGIRWIRAWVPVPVKIDVYRYPPLVILAAALYGVPSTGVSPPRAIAGYKHRWLAFS